MSWEGALPRTGNWNSHSLGGTDSGLGRSTVGEKFYGGYRCEGRLRGREVNINTHFFQFTKPQALFEPQENNPKYEVHIMISIAQREK